MRSIVVIGGVLFIAAVLFSSGILPKRAGATVGGTDSDKPLSEVKLAYARFEDEQDLLAADRARASSAKTPTEQTETPEPGTETATEPQPDNLISAEPAEPHDPLAEEDRDYLDFGEGPEPVAAAGRDQVVWLGRNELTLDAAGSTGEDLTYFWEQVSGPRPLKIADATKATTTVTGLTPEGEADWRDAKYEFVLTVLDVYGRESSDRVRYEVRTTPTLSVRPRAQQRLALRDGYLLAHMESWQTNTTGETETFQLRSPGELFIQQIGGQTDFELTLLDSTDGYLYQVTVFYREGQATTYVEFFVDTSERIPAIVQLGVSWE
ncbi:MAG: hypothetical protein PVJ57_18400 [Phycisphaerae bacterium]|jgi:hypothetical protein